MVWGERKKEGERVRDSYREREGRERERERDGERERERGERVKEREGERGTNLLN